MFFITLLTFERVKCNNNDDDIDQFLDEEDSDDEPEPIKKRQLNVVRETLKSVVSGPIKFFTNGRLIKGVQAAIQTQRIPKPGSGSGTAASSAGSIIGTIYRTMRSNLIKQSTDASSALRKQLQTITKRLSNSKVIIGNLVGSHKMTNREESATKEATADLVAEPTAETKTVNSSSQKSGKTVEDVSNFQAMNNQQPMHQPYPYQMMAAPPAPYYQSPVEQQHLMYQMPVYPELLL